MSGIDERKHHFFQSMFLECVCDAERKSFLESSIQMGLTEFRTMIAERPYDELLDSFVKMIGAKTAVLFQSRKCKTLTEGCDSRSITILSRSTESTSHRIGILRSELLDFYNGACARKESDSGSSLLMEIEDTVRVVAVAETQHDPMVVEYTRDACVISYIQLNYTDRLSPEKQSIFFAFLFDAAQKDNLARLLECIRCLLSFRYDLKLRIEKDFNGNSFGKRAEATWSSDWLSLEKAGAHTDSSEISRLLKKVDFKSSNIMEILFPADGTTVVEANTGADESASIRKEIVYRFIYNINISMYYRAAISQGDDPFSSVDNIIKSGSKKSDRYYRIEDVLKFSQVSEEKIFYGTGERSDVSAIESINQALLFGKTSNPRNDSNKLTGGIPRKKTLTIRRRYLQAFILDILHNAGVHGKGPARIYLEPKQDTQMYLVVCNEVPLDKEIDPVNWCLKKNYELKQAAEFDHATDPNAKKGMSLGCIAHCMKDYGGMIARHRHQNGKVYFEIKLPIVQQ